MSEHDLWPTKAAVVEAAADGKGFWKSCSGCHESNEGHPTGPYHPALQCHVGGGCFECGGIGAVWDTTDYAAMGDYLARELPAPLAAPIWPDFIAPPKYENPDPRWVDPVLPDFRLIWKVARECGYAVGLHGSMKRDCDMIAAPWTDEAVVAFELIERLCAALNAKVIGPIAGKPHGRLGWNLQVDDYVKVIDISVMPRASDRLATLTPTAVDASPPADPVVNASDYSLAPHLQRIVEGAKTAPQWDNENDRMAAPDPAAIREGGPNRAYRVGYAAGRAAALREAARLVSARCDAYVAEHGSYDYSTGTTEYPGDGAEWVEEWTDIESAILALIKKGATE